MRHFFVGLGLAGCFAACGVGADDTQLSRFALAEQTLDHDNLAPGRGYNLLTDEVHDFCLQDVRLSTIAGIDGQRTVFSLDLVEDSKSLAQKMSVSAAASISFGFSGAAGKAQFVADSELSQTSVFALAAIRVINAPRFVDHPQLQADAADTLRFDPERFRERCGDGFVSALSAGAEYFGLIEIATSNEHEKQQVKAALKANGATWSAQAEFERAVNASVSNKTVHVRTYQSGGNAPSGTPCTSVTCILTRASEMLSVAEVHPSLIDAKVLSYRKLALPNDVPLPIDTQHMQEVENAIVGLKSDLLKLRGEYTDALRNPDFVEPFDGQQLQQAVQTCDRNLQALRAAGSACYRSYQTCVLPPLEPLVVLVPARLCGEF